MFHSSEHCVSENEIKEELCVNECVRKRFLLYMYKLQLNVLYSGSFSWDVKFRFYFFVNLDVKKFLPTMINDCTETK